MAAYVDLVGIATANSDALHQQVKMAIAKTAYLIANGASPTANQMAWAKAAVADPDAAVNAVIWYVLAKYDTLTPAQLTGASDASVLTAVQEAVSKLFGS